MLRKSQIEGKTLQPPLAYGDLGRKPDIPPDSRITYLFGLLHFEKQKEMAEMTWAQVGGILNHWIFHKVTYCFGMIMMPFG